MTTYLMINTDGIVENIAIGLVDIPGYAFVEQRPELSRVGIGWIYNAVLDAYADPRAPELTAYSPDVSQDEFVWSEELGTYVNLAMLPAPGTGA